ncbi:YegS/Rv2252/BmrU family lipid kinase [Lachnospiraceae bacterium ZAX-1]
MYGYKTKNKKLLFIFNPRSGKEQIKNKLLRIIDIFVKQGFEVTVHPTQGPQDARRMIERKAGKYGLIVCSGGDGTLDETVTGMMHRGKKVPIGFIPAGTTNDFAKSLNIPKDMIKAAQIAINGRPFACDVGNFNGDYFIYIAAFGVFTDIAYETSQDLKNILGHAAYVLEGIKRLPSIHAYHMKVEYGEQIFEDDFIYGMVTNSTSVGGFKNMTGKDVLLDDGVFEVMLIKMPQNPLELNEIVGNLVNLVDGTDFIYSFKTDYLKITAEEDIPWTLDGEFGGNHRELEIRNENKAIELMIKNDKIGLSLNGK